ncbi:ABC transporter permease [Acidimangrovimonas sediminis]|uniref:ABC transporter permease n=1 Tax=Acidimangrovimonas sediminis TaxID=2056283 RepID=UPI000C7FDFA1|nr:ABC transporter permease [Acidimangrovimonas sediminis]
MSRHLKSREALLLLAIVVMTGAIALRFPAFIAPLNLIGTFTDTSPLIILALGEMVVILCRCIDLSVAANLALAGMIAAMLDVAGVPLPLIILAAVAAGALVGAINGVLVWKLDIPPIVVTLGTMTIARGMIFVLSGGKWINDQALSGAFKGFPRAVVLGLPVLAWIAIAVVLVFVVLIRATPLGRAFFAVGGNPNAAVYTGIDVGRTQFWAFTLSGALAGLAGYLWISRYAVAYVDIANGFELDVVAACVIGGISIAGGAGSVAGAFLGALFLGITKNALPVIGVSPFWQMAISGAAILAAVAINARESRRPGRIILKSVEQTALEART